MITYWDIGGPLKPCEFGRVGGAGGSRPPNVFWGGFMGACFRCVFGLGIELDWLLLFIWLFIDALETPAANTDTGIADPAIFRAWLWKFSIIAKA